MKRINGLTGIVYNDSGSYIDGTEKGIRRENAWKQSLKKTYGPRMKYMIELFVSGLSEEQVIKKVEERFEGNVGKKQIETARNEALIRAKSMSNCKEGDLDRIGENQKNKSQLKGI